MGGHIWEVVGGKKEGGITVRTEKDLKSKEAPTRLSTGALVAELALEGERLRFTRLTGEGPNDGWVSLKFKGRSLLVEAGDIGSTAAAEKARAEELKNATVKEGARKIWVCPQGSRGDVQPVLALAVEARRRGWAVRMFAAEDYKDFIESYGIRWTEWGPPCKKVIQDAANFTDEDLVKEFNEDPAKVGGAQLDTVWNKENRAKMAEVLLAELEKDQPDVLVSMGLAGSAPFLAWLQAGAAVYFIDYVGMAALNSDEGLTEEARNSAEEGGPQMMEAVKLDPFEGVKDDELLQWKRRGVICVVTSEMVRPEMMEFLQGQPEEALEALRKRYTGPLVLDVADQMVDLSQFGGQETLQKLQDFIDDGPPPVYVGWGSMPMHIFTVAKVAINLKINKLRAVVLGGWAKLTQASLEDFVKQQMPEDPFGLVDYSRKSLLFIPVAPHEWLFQRCLFTVHHGGAGTTQAALRAGVPTIITPFSFDQFHWADWVVSMGCGVKLSLQENQEKIMDPAWSKAFRKCGSDAAMRARSQEVAEIIRKERGARAVMDLFEADLEERGKQDPPKKAFGLWSRWEQAAQA